MLRHVDDSSFDSEGAISDEEETKIRNVNTKKLIQSQKHRINFDNGDVIKHSLTKKKSKKKRKKTPRHESNEGKTIKKKKSNIVNKTVIQINKQKTMIIKNNNNKDKLNKTTIESTQRRQREQCNCNCIIM